MLSSAFLASPELWPPFRTLESSLLAPPHPHAHWNALAVSVCPVRLCSHPAPSISYSFVWVLCARDFSGAGLGARYSRVPVLVRRERSKASRV